MDNYRGYRITYGRVGKGCTDGFAVYKGLKFITGAGTFKRARINKKYWEFWKQQARVTVDSLIREKGGLNEKG